MGALTRPGVFRGTPRNRTWDVGVAVIAGAVVGLCAVSGVLRGVIIIVAYMVVSLAVLMACGLFDELQPSMKRATFIFLIAKLGTAVISLTFTAVLFAGVADAIHYSNTGARIAFELHAGLPTGKGFQAGTAGIEMIVGYLYSVITPNIWLGFIVFAWTGGIGVLLVWLGAARHWEPDARRKLGLSLMFMPSLLYWTSPISKESIVILGIGIFVVGAAMLFNGRHVFGGWVVALVGAVVTVSVRPDATLLLTVSIIVATILPWSRSVVTRPSLQARLLTLILFLLVLVPVIAANRQLLHLHQGQNFIQGALNEAQNEQSIGGGSAFTATTTTSLTQVPNAVVSVLFRPFPWEARSPLELLSSAEGVFLAVWGVRVLWRWRGRKIRPRVDGMMLMSLTFLILFCVAFSSLGNYGLLVRERVQELPFLLIVLTSFETVEARRPLEAFVAPELAAAGQAQARRRLPPL